MSRGHTALVYEDEPARFGAALAASKLRTGGGASVGPLRRDDDFDPPELPGPEWVRIQPRLSGICGSDLAAVNGQSSRWFEPIITLPFVPGHEVVADHDGTRVLIEPVLGCAARAIEPRCDPCAAGDRSAGRVRIMWVRTTPPAPRACSNGSAGASGPIGSIEPSAARAARIMNRGTPLPSST